MTMKKKKYNARFPPARIKKIMQTDEDVGKVAQPVPVIISRALELFVENLLKKANEITSQRGARTLTPSHLKMCIKSEKRFDFLKELVSSVPDLQGDHDDPPAQPPKEAVGLDLTMSTLTAAAASSNQDQNKNTSVANSRPTKLPRQLSTGPRPRGRPRTVSADSFESKIPKKRRKMKKSKFVDDVEDLGDELSDQSEAETEAITEKKEPIVTCTVTTNGVNNGSILGFTLTFPSTSSTASSSSCNGKEQENLALVAHDNNTKPVQADVDEDYDDC